MADFVYLRGRAALQYTDQGSGAKLDLSVFRNTVPPPDGIPVRLNQYLGQVPLQTPGYDPGLTCTTLYLFFLDDSSVVPVGAGTDWWTQVWNDHGSGKSNDYAVWTIRPEKIPAGFVALSPCFFKQDHGYQPPTSDEVRGQVLVKSNLVQRGRLKFVWNDHGTGANEDVTIYTGEDDGLGLFAFPNYNPPPSDQLFPMLDFSKGTELRHPLA